jgi:hypothetical protein
MFLDALHQKGDEIIYLHCDQGIKDYCMTMASSGISIEDHPERKAAVCKMCCEQSKLIRDKFEFNSISLKSCIEQQDIDFADRLALWQIEDLERYTFNGIPLGKIAAYEAVIQSKHMDVRLYGKAEKIYRVLLRNCYLIAVASFKILKEHKVDVGVTYHSAYSYNRVFQEAANSIKLPAYSLNTSYNVAEHDTHLVATKDNPYDSYRRQIAEWPLYRDRKCHHADFELAGRHLTSLMSGVGLAFSVALRSSKISSMEGIHLQPGKKIVLVTLSSYDELLATELAGFGWSRENLVFSSQIEWVEWLFEYAKTREDIQIIIRVHPREFPINNKGERSAHSYKLECIFDKKPHNVIINLPSDRIPVYELMMKADVVLVAWSSAGLEASMLGIPVVTYCEDALLYPSSLLLTASDKAAYRDAVDSALTQSWSIDKALISFRWAVFFFVKSRVSIANNVEFGWRGSLFWKYVNRRLQFVRRRLIPLSNEEWDVLVKPNKLNDRDAIFELVHKGLFSFYELEDKGLNSQTPNHELAALRSVLSSIAAHFKKYSGKPAERLLEMIGDGTLTTLNK